MVNSFLIDPDSELVFALNHSIAKSRFPGAYDAHKSKMCGYSYGVGRFET
jgi:hypothetical protein